MFGPLYRPESISLTNDQKLCSIAVSDMIPNHSPVFHTRRRNWPERLRLKVVKLMDVKEPTLSQASSESSRVTMPGPLLVKEFLIIL